MSEFFPLEVFTPAFLWSIDYEMLIALSPSTLFCFLVYLFSGLFVSVFTNILLDIILCEALFLREDLKLDGPRLRIFGE